MRVLKSKTWYAKCEPQKILTIKYANYEQKGREMVGKRIKAYLDENGIRQTFIVERTGLTPAMVSDICKGKREIRVLEYAKICDALKVPYETFIKD